MKKYFVLLLIILMSGYAHAEEAIMLIPDDSVEKNINLETPNPDLLEKSPQKLNNNGVILQNSISPVHGLIYRSNSIPTERKINDKPQTNE